ncbi:hypothetical protein HYFRA_00004911 [Hymenoscyphus fraxineus]|uniref:Uncharacterized protein n=1 Tax=Hymenoscyphus fraxineus TaxID=746836 RepID=A0A9N9KLP9_9HELO|nr:hypothetical protein HYFRA_00004911 [Hymenoscyphus fraxineus]
MLFHNVVIFALMAVSALAAPMPDPDPKKGLFKLGKSKKNKKKNDAGYHCVNSSGRFTIKQVWALKAMATGGTEPGLSSYPHQFFGMQGDGGSAGTQLKFIGADSRCNEKDPQLLEFPVAKDGKLINKNMPGGAKTPARVVYLKSDPKVLCGVMTHIAENKLTGRGSGDFKVCDMGAK